MEPLIVRTRDGQIWIEQSQNGEDYGIVIDPTQVPTLVAWLQEAVAELQNSKNTAKQS